MTLMNVSLYEDVYFEYRLLSVVYRRVLKKFGMIASISITFHNVIELVFISLLRTKYKVKLNCNRQEFSG